MNEQTSDTELPINDCGISAEDDKLKSAVCILVDYSVYFLLL